MLVNNLEYAEAIVNNFQELKWVGWDIVSWKKNPKGIFDKNGKYINGYWGIQTTYSLEKNGWHLPNKYRINYND